jgi:glycolate oxidase FAD binding subunit
MRSSGTDGGASPADIAVAGKALAAVCQELREGTAADAIEGVGPAFVASPASTEEAAALLRAAAEHDLAVVPRGAGSRLGWGPPPTRCDLVVDMRRMDAVTEHAAGDLVARVQAGARMGEVSRLLGLAGQEIALDVPAGATVGGVVASGLAGPRRLRYGSPRDLLIGITIVRADGTVARSGGKVVKNVAGYDLGKLFAGSAGTLGLITEATFRLHPLPAARLFVTAEFTTAAAGCDAVTAAANSPLVPSAVEVTRAAPGGPLRIGVLLEGSADGVAARAARMVDLLGAGEVAESPPPWWPGAPKAHGGTLIRVSFWVSALGRVLGVIDEAAGETGLSPLVHGSAGAGALYMALPAPGGQPPGDPPHGGPRAPHAPRGGDSPSPHSPLALAEFTGALRRVLDHERGSVVVLAAPAPVRDALDGHGGMAGRVASLGLMRAVKDQFDPGHRMAPGRFPEVI